MNQGQLVFAQLMQHLPLTTFRRCVTRYQGERKIKSFSCLDQFLCMAFAQLTYRESLRDIEACLRAQQSKLPRIGILIPANPEPFWNEFQQGLREHDYIEGQTIQFEFRSAEGRPNLLRGLADELVRAQHRELAGKLEDQHEVDPQRLD